MFEDLEKYIKGFEQSIKSINFCSQKNTKN